jgi:hypothetical protein
MANESKNPFIHFPWTDDNPTSWEKPESGEEPELSPFRQPSAFYPFVLYVWLCARTKDRLMTEQ